MKIIAISDLHGHLPKIPKCDVVCICGDIIPLEIQDNDIMSALWIGSNFINWALNIDCDKVIFIGGNHDKILANMSMSNMRQALGSVISKKIVYLSNNSYRHKNKLFYGIPNVENLPYFSFNVSNEELIKLYKNIPNKCDVLISHMPPRVDNLDISNGNRFGSKDLVYVLYEKTIKYLFCGHIHSCGGNSEQINNTLAFNVSYLNDFYNPFNKPLEIII